MDIRFRCNGVCAGPSTQMQQPCRQSLVVQRLVIPDPQFEEWLTPICLSIPFKQVLGSVVIRGSEDQCIPGYSDDTPVLYHYTRQRPSSVNCRLCSCNPSNNLPHAMSDSGLEKHTFGALAKTDEGGVWRGSIYSVRICAPSLSHESPIILLLM